MGVAQEGMEVQEEAAHQVMKTLIIWAELRPSPNI